MTDLTIGVPVYNGAEQIGEALDNLCAQSIQDVRILVSDNASTDATAAIVAERAQTDSRIQLFVQTTNLGPVGNFRFLADQARTPFFAWRAHDDLSDQTYFEVLLDRLRASPKAALCAPCTLTRRPKGDRRRPFPEERRRGEALGWRDVHVAEAGWFYGVYRTGVAQSGAKNADELYPHVWGWDYVVIVSALLDGGIVGTNAVNFIHQLTPKISGQYDFDKRKLREIYKDFVGLGQNLSTEHALTGLDHLRFRLNLARLAGKRVTRWQRLLRVYQR